MASEEAEIGNRSRIPRIVLLTPAGSSRPVWRVVTPRGTLAPSVVPRPVVAQPQRQRILKSRIPRLVPYHPRLAQTAKEQPTDRQEAPRPRARRQKTSAPKVRTTLTVRKRIEIAQNIRFNGGHNPSNGEGQQNGTIVALRMQDKTIKRTKTNLWRKASKLLESSQKKKRAEGDAELAVAKKRGPPLCVVSPRRKETSPNSEPDQAGGQLLRFHCCDHKMVYVAPDLMTCYSKWMRDRQSDPQFRYSCPIFLRSINSDTLLLVIMWMEQHREIGDDLGTIYEVWDKQFLSRDLSQLLELILAANFLEVEQLKLHAGENFSEIMSQRTTDEQDAMNGIRANLNEVRSSMVSHQRLLGQLSVMSRRARHIPPVVPAPRANPPPRRWH